ncbi:MAG: preprotein translocase subunit SecG [Armatimonadetes bacterium]|jgi:protein translocase, SecG subunit|nr:preprotein translocase subunit SecG [Armatimonadota bacterium]
MEILKAVLTWIDIIIMVLFIGLVAIQTSRSEGIFSPGAADSMFGKAKPGFDDNLSRLTLILAVTMFVLTAVVTYMP